MEVLSAVQEYGTFVGFLVAIFEARRFANKAMEQSQSALEIARAQQQVLQEIRDVTVRLTAVTEHLDRRIEVLEDRAQPTGTVVVGFSG